MGVFPVLHVTKGSKIFKLNFKLFLHAFSNVYSSFTILTDVNNKTLNVIEINFTDDSKEIAKIIYTHSRIHRGFHFILNLSHHSKIKVVGIEAEVSRFFQ